MNFVLEPELFGDELFGEPPRLETENQEIIETIPNIAGESDDDASDHFDARAPSPNSSCHESPLVNQKEGIFMIKFLLILCYIYT